MRRLALATLALAILGSGAVASAQEKKADPNGTWAWKFKRGDREIEQSVTLKLEGDKLTGTMPARGNAPEVKIEEGKYKDGEVSFKVTRERGGNKVVTKYTGKVSGDTIKGKMARDGGNNAGDTDWEAKRETKKAA